MKKVISAVGIISGLITIVQFFQSLIKENQIIITPLFLVFACLAAGSCLVLLFFYHKRVRYYIFKHISYVTRRPNLPYYLKEDATSRTGRWVF